MEWKFLQISSGQGPGECRLFVTLLAVFLRREAENNNLECDFLDEPGKQGNASILLRLRGETAEAFARSWTGTMQWIQPSPLRPHHPRKNWFAGITEVEFAPGKEFHDAEFRVETRRASGHGGQHLNKTDSAVRITHLPTGESAEASEERSQLRNRETALLRLIRKLRERERKRELDGKQARRHDHYTLIRGAPRRIFTGSPLREIEKGAVSLSGNP